MKDLMSKRKFRDNIYTTDVIRVDGKTYINKQIIDNALENSDANIIQCFECDYWNKMLCSHPNRHFCDMISKPGMYQYYTTPEHFCGYGKHTEGKDS